MNFPLTSPHYLSILPIAFFFPEKNPETASERFSLWIWYMLPCILPLVTIHQFSIHINKLWINIRNVLSFWQFFKRIKVKCILEFWKRSLYKVQGANIRDAKKYKGLNWKRGGDFIWRGHFILPPGREKLEWILRNPPRNFMIYMVSKKSSFVLDPNSFSLCHLFSISVMAF